MLLSLMTADDDASFDIASAASLLILQLRAQSYCRAQLRLMKRH